MKLKSCEWSSSPSIGAPTPFSSPSSSSEAGSSSASSAGRGKSKSSMSSMEPSMGSSSSSGSGSGLSSTTLIPKRPSASFIALETGSTAKALSSSSFFFTTGFLTAFRTTSISSSLLSNLLMQTVLLIYLGLSHYACNRHKDPETAEKRPYEAKTGILEVLSRQTDQKSGQKQQERNSEKRYENPRRHGFCSKNPCGMPSTWRISSSRYHLAFLRSSR